MSFCPAQQKPREKQTTFLVWLTGDRKHGWRSGENKIETLFFKNCGCTFWLLWQFPRDSGLNFHFIWPISYWLSRCHLLLNNCRYLFTIATRLTEGRWDKLQTEKPRIEGHEEEFQGIRALKGTSYTSESLCSVHAKSQTHAWKRLEWACVSCSSLCSVQKWSKYSVI